jgi:hypothetical protein
MDVSPISAIRPAAAVRAIRVAPDLSRVFEVEYLGQPSGEEYAPPEDEGARGMEDEEGDSAGSPEAELEVAQNVAGRSSVDCFA